MTIHDDHVRAALPRWTRPLDVNARRMLGDIHEDDRPIVAQTPAGWLIVARAPDGADHSVVRPTYEEAAAFLASLEAAQEADNEPQIPLAPIARLDRDPGRLDSDIHDLPGAGEVGGDSGAAGLGGLGDAEIRAEQEDAAGRERGHEGELHEPAASGPEYVAVEVDTEAPADPALDAEVTDAAGAGTMIERDEIARLIKELAVAIAFRREDLLEGVGRRISEILEAQVLYFNTPVHEDADVMRFNAEQGEHATLLLRKSAIERFADDARKGLEGKTLEYLKTIDVAAMGWPS